MNPELVGRSFPPTPPYLVGREKVREFASAVLATDPISFDLAAAHADFGAVRALAWTAGVIGALWLLIWTMETIGRRRESRSVASR